MIRISLIIPTHNRADDLIRALESVAVQTLAADEWECVVIDNASTDDTPRRFEEFRTAHPTLHLRRVYEPQAGVSYARNRGFREAVGELLASIDDDERVNPDFLKAYLHFFDTHPHAIVAGGRIIAEYPAGRPDWLSKFTEMPIANPMHFGDTVRPFPRGRVPGGGNMAFRRKEALRYKGFDVTLGRVGRELIGGEENDLFERMLKGGETIWYVPDAVMWHIIPQRKLSQEYFRRLCRNVGISQQLRARIHHRLATALFRELLKWVATLLLCCTMSPRKSSKLLVMRYEISRGLLRKL